ncbi:MAG: ATP-binding cassette domain-containing protein, partial [Deltaproteobacteria bacterium]
MLEVRGIDAGYGDVQVLFSLSLSVGDKEIVTLLGSNGAGKTTTLRCICGVVSPRKGEVFFKGQSLSRVAPADRTRLGIAQVPEGR